MTKPMTKVALKALRGSIEKWEKIVAGTGVDLGTDNCPLCEVFRVRYDAKARPCVGCPVRARSGLPGCRGTPYDVWMSETASDGFERVAGSAEAKVAAQAELDFLRSLLPPEAAS